MITVLFLTKNSSTSIDVLAGSLPWSKIHDWYFHFFVRFWWTYVRLCGKNSRCTMPLQSKNTVSKTFTFDRTRRAFFGLGSSGRFHWYDWALVSVSYPYTHNLSPVMTFLSHCSLSCDCACAITQVFNIKASMKFIDDFDLST